MPLKSGHVNAQLPAVFHHDQAAASRPASANAPRYQVRPILEGTNQVDTSELKTPTPGSRSEASQTRFGLRPYAGRHRRSAPQIQHRDQRARGRGSSSDGPRGRSVRSRRPRRTARRRRACRSRAGSAAARRSAPTLRRARARRPLSRAGPALEQSSAQPQGQVRRPQGRIRHRRGLGSSRSRRSIPSIGHSRTLADRSSAITRTPREPDRAATRIRVHRRATEPA